MADLATLLPEHNVVHRDQTTLWAVTDQVADIHLNMPARFDPDNIVYSKSTNEIVGASRKVMSSVNEKGQLVVATFSEHGAMLVSLVIDGHEVIHQGTFARISEQDIARGLVPVGMPQLGTDGLGVHRMHGILETSLATFEQGLSDLQNGRIVFSIKGEEFCGPHKYPDSVCYITHQLDKDGGIITSIQIFNDSPEDLHFAPGTHPYFQRHISDANPLQGVHVPGIGIASERELLQSFNIPTTEILEVRPDGQIVGVKASLNDNRKIDLTLIPLWGYLGRDAEVIVWSDALQKYICVEMTWGGEEMRGKTGRDYLTVPKKTSAFISMKQLVEVGAAM